MPKTYKLYLLLVLLLLQFSALAQCAMCRAVLESEEGSHQAEAINNGIVYLMIFPYLLVGIVFYVVYRMKFPKEKKAVS